MLKKKGIMSKPNKIYLTVKFQINPKHFDDDVDWSDVKKIIQDQIGCVGYREVVDFNEEPEIVEIESYD